MDDADVLIQQKIELPTRFRVHVVKGVEISAKRAGGEGDPAKASANILVRDKTASSCENICC